MRITGGAHRSRRIVAPHGKDVRPSTDRTREGLFNRLVHRTSLENAVVLDLFAGSGALGLEALSRGAARATFVDISRRSLAAVRKNIETLQLEAQSSLVQSDVPSYLARLTEKPDLVFCDPPYEFENLENLISGVLDVLSPDGLFILEHSSRYSYDDHDNFVTSGTYGKSRVTFFEQTT